MCRPVRVRAEPAAPLEALPLFPRTFSEDGFMSVDGLLRQAGGFGNCQRLTTLFGFYLWAVHGAQVMAFVFVGKQVENEFEDDDERWLLRLTGSFFFIGWMAGLGLWGWLASKNGWLVALAWMEAMVVVGGLLTAACGSARAYLVCRTLVGFAEGGVPTCAYGYVSEFLLPSHKTQSITALQLGFIGGSMLLAAAAASTGGDADHAAAAVDVDEISWRVLTVATSLCALPVPLIAHWLPESPRWLLRAGRTAQCARVLRTVSRINGHGDLECDSLDASTYPSASDRHRDSDSGEGSGNGNGSGNGRGGRGGAASGVGSVLGLVCSGGAVSRITLVVSLHSFAYTGAYFGLSMVSAAEASAAAATGEGGAHGGGGGGHGNVVNLALQVPVVFIAARLLDSCGRRVALFAMLAGLAAACLALALLPPESEAGVGLGGGGSLHGWLAMLGCMLSNGMFSAGYVCSAEMFPTEVRSIGLSTMSQSARLGGAMAPLILMLGDWNARLPFAVWGTVAAAASLAALLLPETRGKASMETLDDLSCLVALPSPVKTLGSGWRSSFRAIDGVAACERA